MADRIPVWLDVDTGKKTFVLVSENRIAVAVDTVKAMM